MCVYGVCDGVANAAKIAQPRKKAESECEFGQTFRLESGLNVAEKFTGIVVCSHGSV